MDKEHTPVLQELNNMQLKISCLFLDLMREKNEQKLNSENLSKKLEQLSNEAVTLKKQNEILRQNNEDMKNIIGKGITVFKSLDFSNLNFCKEYKMALETLKTTFFEFSKKIETCSAIGRNVPSEEKEKKKNNDNTGYKLSNEEIEKEFEGLSSLNFSTDFSYYEAVDENLQKKNHDLNRSRSDTVLKSLFQNTSVIKTAKEPSSDYESLDSKLLYSTLDTDIRKTSPPPHETETRQDRSPVFKDIGTRKHDVLSDSGNSSSTSLPSKLINEKFLEKSGSFEISPWKKSSRDAIEKTPKKSPASKRVRKKLKINTPERSPRAVLKNSNMREAEMSFSGVRKFRQTVLNLDCFKKDNVEDYKNSKNRENENFESYFHNKNEKKVVIDDENDVFITETPNKADQISETIKIEKTEPNLNEVMCFTPPQASDPDFDETYISSSFLRKCNATNKREPERIIEDQTPLKRHAREENLENDSVPFVYKQEPVRKRAERMKLPGHACVECMKYYKNAYGDLETQDLKKMLNKCSRHRDRNSPTDDDTPPGYWKPYLTCSTIMTPNEDDVSKAFIN